VVGVFKYDFVTNLPRCLTMTEFYKSVNIWRSYGQQHSVLFFSDSQCSPTAKFGTAFVSGNRTQSKHRQTFTLCTAPRFRAYFLTDNHTKLVFFVINHNSQNTDTVIPIDMASDIKFTASVRLYKITDDASATRHLGAVFYPCLFAG